MKERPLPLAGQAVRAILDGRKTQTRRVVVGCVENPGVYTRESWERGEMPRCPYGEPGDRLWVRETYQLDKDFDEMSPSDADAHCTAHHHAAGVRWAADGGVDDEGDSFWGKLRPSIHMPRWASRITLAVESIRVERLQEITEDDARAEGVSAIPGQDFWSCFCEATHDSFDMTVEPDAEYRREHGITHVKHVPAVPTPARVVRARLWDQTHAKRPGFLWADNPYVWVVGFRRVP